MGNIGDKYRAMYCVSVKYIFVSFCNELMPLPCRLPVERSLMFYEGPG